MDRVASICLANSGYCNPKKMMERIMEIGSKIKVGAFDSKESRDMLEVVRSGNGLHYLIPSWKVE